MTDTPPPDPVVIDPNEFGDGGGGSDSSTIPVNDRAIGLPTVRGSDRRDINPQYTLPPPADLRHNRGMFGGFGAPVITSAPHYTNASLDQLTGTGGGSIPRGLTIGAQQMMVEAGLLNPGSITEYGRWDNSSVSAFKEVLAIANRSGETWNGALSRMVRSGANLRSQSGGGGGGGGRAPFQPRTPNREEVKRNYRAIRQRELGGNFAALSDEAFKAEQEAFANAYEAQVVGAQRAAYEGRAVQDAPGVESAALDKLEKEREGEVKANDFAGLARTMTEVLGGS
jgi:hypothetical protein